MSEVHKSMAGTSSGSSIDKRRISVSGPLPSFPDEPPQSCDSTFSFVSVSWVSIEICLPISLGHGVKLTDRANLVLVESDR